MDKILPFKTEQITDRITRITGITGEMMYLVEGNEKAALIDTGVGAGNLKELVEKITSKPIFVLLTHGHVDHAMGAPAFQEVYMNPADEKVYNEHMNLSIRKEFIQMNAGERFALINDNDYIMPRKLDYKPLLPGEVFSLGGITLEIYEARGHTPGSVAILLKDDRILLLGDACNAFTFLFDANSISIKEYREVLKKLDAETQGKYDRTLFSHGSGDDTKDMIHGVIKVCDDILSGNADNIPFSFLGSTAYIAKEMDQNFKRKDNGIGNIVYDKNRT